MSNQSAFFAKLNDKLDALANWHAQKTDYAALARQPMTRAFALLAVIMALVAGIVNYQIRDNQYQVWQDNPDLYFLDQTPLFSTTDASYFLGMARQYQQTGDVNDYDAKRLYPYYEQSLSDAEPRNSITDFPLLSVIISAFSPDSSTQSLLKTGNGLIPLLGFVMALGVLLAFGAAGFWLEGAVAAIGAGICYSFLVRTSIGRIDTDILNLGFFYAVLGLTVFAGRAQSWRAAIIWAVLAGLMLNIFFWWYEKAFMGWAFAIGMVWLSCMTSRDWRKPIVLVILFVFVSGLIFKDFGITSRSAYVVDTINIDSFIFPNTHDTITELRVFPFLAILEQISGHIIIGFSALCGLLLFAVRYPVLAVVYFPASVFALANFLVGNRAVFYSAPMIWFGLAFLVMVLAQIAYSYTPQKIRGRQFVKEGVLLTVSILLASLVVITNPVRDYVPNATFPKEIMRGFAAMNGNLPDDAVIVSWWDYGYASMLFNPYRTLHDPGTNATPVTHYVGRALMAQSQQETSDLLNYIVNTSQDESQLGVSNYGYREGEKLPSVGTPPVYLVLTEQIANWAGSISKLALWDTTEGKPLKVIGQEGQPLLTYNKISCQPAEKSSQAICGGQLIDLVEGTVNGQPLLRSLMQTNNGKLQFQKSLNQNALTHLHLNDVDGQPTSVRVFHDRLAVSTFHNLFYLGRSEPDKFEMVYDDFPHMRIYRLK